MVALVARTNEGLLMFIEPMLARAAEEDHLDSKDWTGWVLEPKHDGMRAIIEVTDGGVNIFSRTGKSQNGKCPHLELSLAKFPVGTVLDGEIALMVNAKTIRGEKVPVVDFNKTMRIMGSGVEKAVLRQEEFDKVVFLLFDVISYGSTSLEDRPQSHRFKVADALDANWLIHNPRYYDNYREVYDDLIANGVEGAIMKNLDATYDPASRSKGWLKVKSAKTFDVVVTGFTEGQGKYVGQIGAIEFGAYMPDGSIKYVGRCSGMTDTERYAWTRTRDACAKMNVPVVDDGYVIEVKANEMVGSGEYRTPRHPQYQHIRTDKLPHQCLMDQFKG